jgi:NAD(P)-dependent dehydrogenase (short-subunit alcohol dehydrogenase family)
MSALRYAAKDAFKGRTVLVTGGGGAIGRAASLAFADAGANVVVNDLPGDPKAPGEGPAERTVKEIKSRKGSAIAVPGSSSEGQKLVDATVKEFGRIDVIVALAGIHAATLFENHTMDDFHRVLGVNTLGMISPVLAAWPHFKKQNYGRVITTTSDTIFGTTRLSSYLFSRGANFIGSRGLAIEGAEHNILVNSIAPVAASALSFDYIKDMEPEVRSQYEDQLRSKFPPEGNVPMILALAHESSTITGEAFSLGAYCASRIVLGFQDGVTNVRTMEEIFERKDEILGSPDKQVKIPTSSEEEMQMLQRSKE